MDVSADLLSESVTHKDLSFDLSAVSDFLMVILSILTAIAAHGPQGLIVAEAGRQGVTPEIALAVAKHESGFNPSAKRWEPKMKQFSMGMFQILPSTARGLGWREAEGSLLTPEVNTRYGIKYLKRCILQFDSIERIGCCYNAGEAATESACNRPSVKAYSKALRAQYELMRKAWLELEAGRLSSEGSLNGRTSTPPIPATSTL